jgi:hypothetical protein
VKPRTTAPPLVKKVEREVEREERDDRLDKPERPKPEEKAGPPGFFTVDANPYANIFIDGKSMGPTPIIKHPLSPGVHRVKAAPQSGKVKFLTITIESGEVFTHKFTW